MVTEHSVDRRRFLRATAAVAATAGLAGCATDTREEDSGVQGAGVVLPTHRKLSAVEPALPGDATGVPDGYLEFPHPAEPVVDAPPGKGGAITAMLGLAGGVTPKPLAANSWWQELNRRIGAQLDITVVPQEYPAKLATVLAGDDLPDLVQLDSVARLPDVLEAKFEDLTEFLSGDAVLEFPALANLGEYAWRTTVFRGGIRATPPSNIVGQPTWTYRADVIESMGGDLGQATDADQLLALAQEVTDAKANRYAFGQAFGVIKLLAAAMFAAPNSWAVRDGAFTHMYETDEYRAAIEYTARLWRAGVMHPDSFGAANAPELQKAGTISLFQWGGVGYRSLLRANIPGLRLGFWAPPLADGSGLAPKRLGTGTYKLCGIRKQESKDRVRELLGVLNFLASPFGSAEYQLIKFGVEGDHFSWDELLRAPVINSSYGEQKIDVGYLASAPYELFDPGNPEATREMYEHQQQTIPKGFSDASIGLYSETFDKSGIALNQTVDDVASNVIQGRADLDAWDKAVTDWKAGGGDRMRDEYQRGYAEL